MSHALRIREAIEKGVLVDIGPEYRTLRLPVSKGAEPIVDKIEALDAQARDIIKKMRKSLSRTEAIVFQGDLPP